MANLTQFFETLDDEDLGGEDVSTLSSPTFIQNTIYKQRDSLYKYVNELQRILFGSVIYTPKYEDSLVTYTPFLRPRNPNISFQVIIPIESSFLVFQGMIFFDPLVVKYQSINIIDNLHTPKSTLRVGIVYEAYPVDTKKGRIKVSDDFIYYYAVSKKILPDILLKTKLVKKIKYNTRGFGSNGTVLMNRPSSSNFEPIDLSPPK